MSVWNELRTAVSGILKGRNSDKSGFGDRGERIAERFLKKLGYKIVARSYRNHIGEIDLVAVDTKSDPRTIVFVEVKTRRSDFRGLPVEAIDERKQRQITETALVYLKQHELLECRYRFDGVGIIWPDEQDCPDVRHYIDLFEPAGTRQLFS